MKLKNTNYKCSLFAVLTIALFVVSTGNVFSNSRSEFRIPDYDSINVNIHKSSSENFYPKIFERYSKGDTTLTSDNFYHLYYGYSFNEAYNPLEVNPMKDSLMVVMQRNQDDNFISPEIFDDMERIALKSLGLNPFDLSVLNMLAFIYQMKGDIPKANEYAFKVNKLKEVIFSTGDGLSKKTPIHVISRNEQDAIIATLGLDFFKRSYVSVDVEVFHLRMPYMGKKGYYFDIGRMWIKQPEPKEIEKHKFEFNPYQNPNSKRYIRPT